MNALIEEALSAEAKGDFGEAIPRYVRVIETHGEQLVRWGPRTFLSASEYARMRLAALPQEGRALLERRYGGTISERLARAQERLDADALRGLAFGIPVDASYRAAEVLSDLHRERGEWSAALGVLQRLLLARASSADEATLRGLRAKAAVCRMRLGSAPFVDPLDPDREQPGEGTVRIAGRDVPIRDFLDGLAGEASAESPAPAWTTFGGDPAHGAIPPLAAAYFQLAWAVSEFDPDATEREPTLSPYQDEPNPVLASFPTVDGDALFAFDGGIAVCLDTARGATRWRRSLEEFGPATPDDRNYFYGSVGGGRFVLVHECLAEHDPEDPYTSLGERARRLVALSAADGAALWSRGGPDDPDEELRSLMFTGPAVLLGNRVFIAGKRIERAGSEDKAYAAAFDASSGALLWRTFLCSAPRPERHRDVYPEGPFLSLGEGALLCGTDMGVISAVDPVTGEHLWAFQYERTPFKSGDGGNVLFSYRESWSDNPMIVRDGRLYATPGDSPYLHILLTFPEASSGLVRLARLEKSGYRYLLGVKDRTVFLAGRDVSYDDSGSYHLVSAFHPEGGERCNLWDFPIPNPLPGREPPKDLPRGRGILGDDKVYFPTTKGIYVLDAERGDLLAQVVDAGGEDRRFGNLLAVGDALVASDRLRIHWYRAKE